MQVCDYADRPISYWNYMYITIGNLVYCHSTFNISLILESTVLCTWIGPVSLLGSSLTIARSAESPAVEL